MVSNQQNMNQVGFDEFHCALRSLGVMKDDIICEPLKIKYSSVAPYSIYQRHSTPTKYEDEEENDNEEEVRPPSHKHWVNKDKRTSSSSLPQDGKGYVHKQPERIPNILYVYEFINQTLTIIFHFISFILFLLHYNKFNKIDIVICNVDRYGDMDWECKDEFAYCKYIGWVIRHDLRYQ